MYFVIDHRLFNVLQRYVPTARTEKYMLCAAVMDTVAGVMDTFEGSNGHL